ncbi:MAG: hypothetical protein AB1578_19020 [Thermodesulfobacteriota bacterium]
MKSRSGPWRCVVLAAVFLLVGCAALQPGARHELALELGVKAATARVLHENPTWRAEVLRIADGALALVGDETAALGALEQYVVAEIPWERLLPEEEELARLSLRLIREETERYLAAQGFEDPAELRVAVARVLGWVREVAGRGAGG